MLKFNDRSGKFIPLNTTCEHWFSLTCPVYQRYFIPKYQRDYVWEQERYEQYILSIFEGYPTAPFFIDTRNTDRQAIIDGKHRIEALKRFRWECMPVNGVKWFELDDITKRSLDWTIIPCYDLKIMTDAEAVEIYLNLNSKAIAHTGQELDKARQILSELRSKGVK